MNKLKWRDIEHLPANHPKVKAFDEQIAEEEKIMSQLEPINSGLDDENSLEYFNRYIAGDK